MKRTPFIITISSAALVLTTLGALANGRGPDFSMLDTDGDGQVTLQEMEVVAQVRFDAADTDGDGFLSQAELEAQSNARAAKRATRMMERMDANKDGKLSPDEMAGRHDPERFFSRMDKDDNGTVSEDEFKEAHAQMKERRRHGQSKD